jgi:hypothetical protein
MKGLIFPWQHLAIFAPNLPFFHRPLPSDHDLGIALLLNVLQGVPSGPNEQPHKVDFWILILRDHYFITHTSCWRLVICRWLKIRVEGNHLCDEVVPLLFKLFAGTELSGVKPLPLTVVDGFRGRGPVLRVRGDAQVSCAQFTSQVFYLQLHYISSFLFPSKSRGDNCRHSWNHCLLFHCILIPAAPLPLLTWEVQRRGVRSGRHGAPGNGTSSSSSAAAASPSRTFRGGGGRGSDYAAEERGEPVLSRGGRRRRETHKEGGERAPRGRARDGGAAAWIGPGRGEGS